MRIVIKLIVTIVIISTIFACSKTTFVGSDIFPDGINVFYKDDFDIIAKTIRRDSVFTFDGSNFMESMLCGRVEDPIFGTTEAEIFIDLHIASLMPPFEYVDQGLVKKVEIDSVVLILAYQPENFYGDSTVAHDISVSRLENKMTFIDTIYSNFRPRISDIVLGEKTLVPNYTDSLYISEPEDTSATIYTGQLRMRIDDSFIQPMIDDTSIVNSDDNFTSYAKGLHIKSIPNGNSFWSMDNSVTTEFPLNSILVYYRQGDVQNTYRIFVDGERSNYYKHDYTGSVVEQFFDNEELGDSLLFLHGMAGPDIEINIPELADPKYNDFLINKAEIEFFVLEDESSQLYEPIERILLQRYDSEGDLIVIEDVFVAFQQLDDASYDGFLTETSINGQSIKKYTATMSIHTLRVFNGENTDTRLRISALDKRQKPNRSVIFGPGHSKFPMKFKLTYSK